MTELVSGSAASRRQAPKAPADRHQQARPVAAAERGARLKAAKVLVTVLTCASPKRYTASATSSVFRCQERERAPSGTRRSNDPGDRAPKAGSAGADEVNAARPRDRGRAGERDPASSASRPAVVVTPAGELPPVGAAHVDADDRPLPARAPGRLLSLTPSGGRRPPPRPAVWRCFPSLRITEDSTV